MTEQQHPIIPPPELVQEWWEATQKEKPERWVKHVATQAARWGADAELEACCKALEDVWDREEVMTLVDILHELRAARRPKPPSLAEQGLDALEQVDEWAVANMSQLAIHDDLVAGVETIRAALKRLRELEQGNG